PRGPRRRRPHASLSGRAQRRRQYRGEFRAFLAALKKRADEPADQSVRPSRRTGTWNQMEPKGTVDDDVRSFFVNKRIETDTHLVGSNTVGQTPLVRPRSRGGGILCRPWCARGVASSSHGRRGGPPAAGRS